MSRIRQGRIAGKQICARFSTTCPQPTASNPFVLKSKYDNFEEIETKRPAFDAHAPITVSKVPDPNWKYGGGASDKSGLERRHVEIDPFEEGRPMILKYKLPISAIPRPVSFLSTVSKDGVANLAPFSYWQVVDHNPPIFVIGFSARAQRKDSLKATSIDVPYGVSEWELSSLHALPSTTVRPSRVKEAIFSTEGKLLEIKELDHHGKGKEGLE